MRPPKCGKCGEADEAAFYPYIRTRCKACNRVYQKEYRRRHAGSYVNKDKKYALKKRYGLSVGEFEAMYDRQGGRCGACNIDPRSVLGSARPQLHVDHCHKSGRVRGLLCNGCNRALGLLNDDPAKITGLLEYARTMP